MSEIEIQGKTKNMASSISKKGFLELSEKQKEIIAKVRARSSIRTYLLGNVYLLIDCSSSMEGDKLNQVKKGALRFAKDALAKGYLTGLIQFASSAIHLCEPQREISVIEDHLNSLIANGTTNMAEAIRIAHQNLGEREELRVMVIATDGMPDSEEEALNEAQHAKKKGIDIITIGTDDADKEFLKKIATKINLSVMVSGEKVGEGIASMAKKLPILPKGK